MLLSADRVSPAAEAPADAPFSSIRGLPEYPDWLAPSIVTELVIVGNDEAGAIVWTPEPPMAKSIVLDPPAALASVIAWRSDPAPASLTLVTMSIAGTSRRSSGSSRGQAGPRMIGRVAMRADFVSSGDFAVGLRGGKTMTGGGWFE